MTLLGFGEGTKTFAAIFVVCFAALAALHPITNNSDWVIYLPVLPIAVLAFIRFFRHYTYQIDVLLLLYCMVLASELGFLHVKLLAMLFAGIGGIVWLLCCFADFRRNPDEFVQAKSSEFMNDVKEVFGWLSREERPAPEPWRDTAPQNETGSGEKAAEAKKSPEEEEKEEKEHMARMIARALEEQSMRYVRSKSRKRPDFEVMLKNRNVAVEIETEKIRPYLVQRMIKNRLKTFSKIIIVVDFPLERHYRKAIAGTKAKVMGVNRFISWLERWEA